MTNPRPRVTARLDVTAIVKYCKCMSQTAIGKGRIQKNSNEIRLLTKGARSEGEYNKGGEKFLT